MARRKTRTPAAGGASPRPEVVWTRAARTRLGLEPAPGDAKSVYQPALLADLLELVRHWTGYPVDGATRDELWDQARELRRRLGRAGVEMAHEARRRAETLRATADPGLRCLLSFLFAGEHAWSRADAEACLARAVVPAWAELLLGSLDDVDLALRIVEGRLRVDPYREVCLRSLEIVHGLGARALPVLLRMFAVLDLDRRTRPGDTHSSAGMSKALRDAQRRKWSAARIPRVIEALEAVRTPEAAAFFASQLGSADTRAIAGRYFRAEPGLALRVLPPVAARRNKAALLARALLEVVHAEHPGLVEAAPPSRRASRPPPAAPVHREASPSEIPPVLADPPWRREGPRHAPHRSVALLDVAIPVDPAVHAHDAWVKRLPHVPQFLVFSPRIACAMASSWLHSAGRRAVAGAWLTAFPEIAAVGLLPRAVGGDWMERNDALRTLRFLRSYDEAAVDRGVARYPAEARATLAAALVHDPLDECPGEPPGRPRFLRLEALPRPLLAGRAKALPPDAVKHLVEMLVFAVDGFPYAGIAQVRAACDQTSLDAFVWAIYEAWLAVGAPSRIRWPMRALGELGGDEIAGRLAPLVRAWPAQRALTRAMAGVRALGRIGTDIALTHLGSIAELSRSAAIKQEARAVLADVARARGLGPHELGDRTVPALDLGPDDGSPAPWEALRGDAQAIVAAQIQRLERTMIAARAWDVPTFLGVVVSRPLIARLLRGLVLAAFDAEGKGVPFRVTEEGRFADAHDAPLSLDGFAWIKIPHPLDMDREELVAWGTFFADYELIQPFPQLGRDVHTLTADERSATALRRFAGARVATRRILDLEGRGWQHVAYDKHTIDFLWKPLPDECFVRFDVQPGIGVVHARSAPEQTVGPLLLFHHGDPAPFGGLDPVVASELLRELGEAFQ